MRRKTYALNLKLSRSTNVGLFAALLLLFAGCMNTPADAHTSMPTIHPTANQNAPDIGITVPAPSDNTPTALPTVGSSSAPDLTVTAIRYTANAQIDLSVHSVTGSLVVDYRNDTGAALSDLVFRIVAAETPNSFILNGLDTGSSDDSFTLNGSRLTITFHQPLSSEASAKVKLDFMIRVPSIAVAALAKNGYFGYSDRQLNLGDWLPAVAPYRSGQWLVPHPWPTIGETDVTDAARYVVTLTVSGVGADADKVLVAGPGAVEHPDAATWRFTLDHGRNFALSVSTSYTVRRAVTPDGISVELYTFDHPSLGHGPDYVLQTAQDALTRYAELYGPCAYKRVVLVQGDFPDGMEFSGIVFIGTSWFTTYNGQPDTWLTLITVHELAHQWWYSSVGDDQSQTPFMDEAFAVYSELLYLEQAYPGLDQWWWNFRVKVYQPEGYVDSSVYDFTSQRLYVNAVYLRGALMLNDVRTAIGDTAFIAWLRAYAHTQADRIATPAALWGLLSPGNYTLTAPVRARYLRNPDPVLSATFTAAPTNTTPDVLIPATSEAPVTPVSTRATPDRARQSP
ncbi:MAG: M1 family aminopeptidase [Aggregatilineales bacterium]